MLNDFQRFGGRLAGQQSSLKYYLKFEELGKKFEFCFWLKIPWKMILVQSVFDL